MKKPLPRPSGAYQKSTKKNIPAKSRPLTAKPLHTKRAPKIATARTEKFKISKFNARQSNVDTKPPVTKQYGKPASTKRSIGKPKPTVVSVVQKSPLPGVRLNKYLADTHVASRREADTLISAKQVLVNGVVAQIGDRVLATDTVTLVGQTKNKRYLAYYKGRGIITHSPDATEVDIKTRLKQDYSISDLSPVGRLDKDSEGLIIISNDGRITGPLLDPEHGNEKEYTVTVDKAVTPAFCKLMEMGVAIEGYRTKPAKVVASPKNATRFNLSITEGKKHQIRRMCAALGYQVQSLKRVRIMNIELGELKPNQYRKIAGQELATFLRSLGL